MISYPARPPQGYPTDGSDREAERGRILRHLLATARTQAEQAGRSISCATGTNHETCVGARDCICPCHDGGATQ